MPVIPKSFFLLRLVCFLLIGVISFGCKKEQSDAIKPDSIKVSFKYKENVVTPTKKRLSYIKEVRDNAIIYKAETPSRKVPKLGEIITSGICEQFPQGIGVKVLGVQTLPNGEYECLTEPVPLDQIFDELKITSYTNLLNSDNDEIIVTDPSGREIALKVVSTKEIDRQRALYNKNFLLAYPLAAIDLSVGKNRSDLRCIIPFPINADINPLGLTADIADASIKHSYKLEGNVHAGLGLIYECDIKAKTYKLALDASCGFEIKELRIDDDLSYSWPLIPELVLKKAEKTFLIDLGPVVLNTTIGFDLDAEVYHEGYFKCHAYKDVGVETGITQNGAYGHTYRKGNEEELIQIDSLDSKTGACVSFKPRLTVGLYDKHFFNGKLEPYLKFGLEEACQFEDQEIFKKNPTFKLYCRGGIEASVNLFEVEIKGKEYGLSKKHEVASFNIWEKGWPLLPVVDSKSIAIVPRKSGRTYVMSYGFSSDGILQKWKDNIYAGAQIVHGDSLILRLPSEGIADVVSAKEKYEFTFDNLSLDLDQSYMARPIVFLNNNVYECNGIAFTVNGLTFNTKDYYI